MFDLHFKLYHLFNVWIGNKLKGERKIIIISVHEDKHFVLGIKI